MSGFYLLYAVTVIVTGGLGFWVGRRLMRKADGLLDDNERQGPSGGGGRIK